MRNMMMDNLRGVLIICVVIGHVISNLTSDVWAIDLLYTCIYYFHMPMLIFIAGYFSKNLDKAHHKAFSTLLLPYLLFTTSYQVLECLLLNTPVELNIYQPSYGSWFLLTLFYYRFSLKYLVKIPRLLGLSIALMLTSGFITGHLPPLLSINRTINFFPFFLMGYYLSHEQLVYISTFFTRRYLSFIILAFVGLQMTLMSKFPIADYLKFDSAFTSYNLDFPILMQVYLLIAIVFVGLIILQIIPKGESKLLTYIGQNTLLIYLGHLYVMLLLRSIWDVSLTGISAYITVIIFPLFIIFCLLGAQILYNKLKGRILSLNKQL